MGISQISTGILRIQDAGTNCYLLEHAGALVFVDAGLPRSWRYTHEALRRIGRSWADVTDTSSRTPTSTTSASRPAPSGRPA